jgi:hypothetical protein
VIVWRAERRNQQNRDLRREQLLIRALQEARSEVWTGSKLHLSDTRLEMELLLMNLRTSAETLTDALAAEAEKGNRAITTDSDGVTCLGQWQDAQSDVEQAQEVYNDALDEYREFLRALPPPLQAKAAERAGFSMEILPA